MLPSIIMNAALIALFLLCLILYINRVHPYSRLFRYFTTLSNMLCAFAALAVLLHSGGALPFWVLLLKYTGTAAVTVTMLTVFIFLGPISHKWKDLLVGPELVLHLINPLLAIVSFVFFEKTELPVWTIAAGVAPVLLYGILYGIKVLGVREERRWNDIYGFNRGGRWKVSFVMMLAAAAVISTVLLFC